MILKMNSRDYEMKSIGISEIDNANVYQNCYLHSLCRQLLVMTIADSGEYKSKQLEQVVMESWEVV